jgi:putative tricarboxylic transport membrane protein
MTFRWKDANLLAGAGLACLSLYILYAASRWTLFSAEGPGPGFFPIVYGLLMLGLSLVLVYQRLTTPVERPLLRERTDTDRTGFVAALLTWTAIVASIPLMWLLGFTVGFGLAVLFMVKVVFGRSWPTSLITAAAISVGLYLVFPVMLSAPLPIGQFWSF